MQGPAVAMLFAPARREEFRFSFLGLGKSDFGGNSNESVEFWIEPLNSFEHQLGQLNRRQLAFTKKLPNLLDGGVREFVVAQAQNIFS